MYYLAVYHAAIPSGESTIYLGYMMIELKRHAPGLPDMTEEEAASIGVAILKISKSLKALGNVEHLYSFVLGIRLPTCTYNSCRVISGPPCNDHDRNGKKRIGEANSSDGPPYS